MSRLINYGAESRIKMLAGVEKLARAVKVTLGPKGRNVVIKKNGLGHIITKDGVTVAHEVELDCPIENTGAQMVKDVAAETSDSAGDGTTTATILAESLFQKGHEASSEVNTMDLKKSLDKLLSHIIEEIDGYSIDIEGTADISNIASISANNDKEIGDLIADAMDKVGQDGIITVEDSKSVETTLETVEGMEIDKGFTSPYYITDTDKDIVEYENAYVLIYDNKIDDIKLLINLLEQVIPTGRPLVIMATDVVGEAQAALIVNHMKKVLKNVVIRAPKFSLVKNDTLEDIAIMTGGKLISSDTGMKLENAKLSDLGFVSKIIVTQVKTTFILDDSTEDAIEERINDLKVKLENSEHSMVDELIEARIAQLSGGVAVIKVGAMSEIELTQKKHRIEDALHATRAAVEDGIVPGGGVTLLRISDDLKKYKTESDADKVAVSILEEVLKVPFRTILSNAGADVEKIEELVLESLNKNFGYNSNNESYIDMIEDGVIDPTKVTKTAIKNAISIVGTMLTTDCSIIEDDSMGGMAGMFPGM